MPVFYASLMDDLTKIEIPTNFESDGVIDVLLKKLNALISPTGTRDNPALSCQDVFNCQGTSFVPGASFIVIVLMRVIKDSPSLCFFTH